MVMVREMIEEKLAKYVLAIFELGEGRAASCMLAISEKIQYSKFNTLHTSPERRYRMVQKVTLGGHPFVIVHNMGYLLVPPNILNGKQFVIYFFLFLFFFCVAANTGCVAKALFMLA